MLLLAKFAGIAVLVWFYLTAKEKGEQPIKWAIIGLIGYWITWWALRLTFVEALSGGALSRSPISAFIVFQIPALTAIAAAFFIRKKLIADIAEK
jgi:hypothetical protein